VEILSIFLSQLSTEWEISNSDDLKISKMVCTTIFNDFMPIYRRHIWDLKFWKDLGSDLSESTIFQFIILFIKIHFKVKK